MPHAAYAAGTRVGGRGCSIVRAIVGGAVPARGVTEGGGVGMPSQNSSLGKRVTLAMARSGRAGVRGGVICSGGVGMGNRHQSCCYPDCSENG
jgi:hypothetical protein